MQVSMINYSQVPKHNKIDNLQTSETYLSTCKVEKPRTKSMVKRFSPNYKINNNTKFIESDYKNKLYKNLKLTAMGKRNQYQSIFRAANFLGLFPVSGLFTSSKKGNDGEQAERGNVQEMEFRPASWRLLATFIFIVAVLFLEGMGIIHMLVATDRSYTDSHVDFVTYRHGTIASDLAPVLHYGATVTFCRNNV
jgi:hypothetical protein